MPVKSFAAAKMRLAPSFDDRSRRELGMAVAERVLTAARATGADVAVVTADDEVECWARSLGVAVIADEPGGGLNGAARAAALAAVREGHAWLIVHADLPLLAVDDVYALLEPLEKGRPVIAPSYDAGTSAIGAGEVIRFAFGPGSFHKHVARLAGGPTRVVVRPGLALDLDHPDDYAVAVRRESGAWIGRLPGVTSQGSGGGRRRP